MVSSHSKITARDGLDVIDCVVMCTRRDQLTLKVIVRVLLALPFGPSLLLLLASSVIAPDWLAPLLCSVTGRFTVTDCPAFTAGTAVLLCSCSLPNTPARSEPGASTEPWLRITTMAVKVWLAVGVDGFSVNESTTRSATG